MTVQGSPASHWSPEHDVLSFGFNSAKEFAQKSQTTMRALVEEGLRRVLADSQAQAKPAFKLKDARVHGKEILMSDPRHWQQLEEEHVAARSRKARPLAP